MLRTLELTYVQQQILDQLPTCGGVLDFRLLATCNGFAATMIIEKR